MVEIVKQLGVKGLVIHVPQCFLVGLGSSECGVGVVPRLHPDELSGCWLAYHGPIIGQYL